MNKLPELVLPGGDLHRTKIAFEYGADAVYVGLDRYSLRKAEVKFSASEIGKAVEIAHNLGKKLYVTFNIFAHNSDLKKLAPDMEKIAKFKPDAFIISDTGVINITKKVAPHVPIHLSTQANTVNLESVKFWQKQGLKRIVLGREVTLKEIKEIKKTVPKMELEVFVHGAMCISYSGRCLLSAYMTGRSANLGMCTQPCRWNYNVFLEEKKRPGEYFPFEENERGTYLMSSKDLCLIEHLDKLANAGVSALKIEGRNKTDYYVATVARTYRQALNLVSERKFDDGAKKLLKKELLALTNRDHTTGFLFGNSKKGETYNSRELKTGKKYLGFVESQKNGYSLVSVKNKLINGQEYELLTPQEILKFKITEMKNAENTKSLNQIDPGRKNEKVQIKTNPNLAPNTFIRELSG